MEFLQNKFIKFIKFNKINKSNKFIKLITLLAPWLLLIILIILLFSYINYLVANGVFNIMTDNNLSNLREKFTNIINETQNTSHSVDLPLNKTYDCKNFCNPLARCAITGNQCFTDVDCPGCKPKSVKQKAVKDCIPGLNDGGKLTTGLTPQFSSLVAGYGTQETELNVYPSRAPQANLGYDIYSASFNETQQLFNKRYKPNNLEFIPNYKPSFTLTGEYLVEEPLPSNTTL